jgi:hypothetical protein
MIVIQIVFFAPSMQIFTDATFKIFNEKKPESSDEFQHELKKNNNNAIKNIKKKTCGGSGVRTDVGWPG